VSFILLFAKVWDGLSDPVVGYLVSKTKLRWGRLRAWCDDVMMMMMMMTTMID
jgi:Na+/melibiose symporter-like transporter